MKRVIETKLGSVLKYCVSHGVPWISIRGMNTGQKVITLRTRREGGTNYIDGVDIYSPDGHPEIRVKGCLGCGAEHGQYHAIGCEYEECPVCCGLLKYCKEQHGSEIEKYRLARIPSSGDDYYLCSICRNPINPHFTVPDEDWSRVVPEKYRKSMICLKCYRFLFDANPPEPHKGALHYFGTHREGMKPKHTYREKE